jgi:hypothetical protein
VSAADTEVQRTIHRGSRRLSCEVERSKRTSDQRDAALRPLDEPAEHVEEGGLAGARAPEQGKGCRSSGGEVRQTSRKPDVVPDDQHARFDQSVVRVAGWFVLARPRSGTVQMHLDRFDHMAQGFALDGARR